MSYILDALRRAEADRQRGQVPNLGVAQLAAAAGDPAKPSRLKLVVTVLLVLTAVGAAGLVGWWRGTGAPAKPPSVEVQAANDPASAALAVPPSPPVQPLPQVVSVPPAVVPTPVPSPPPVAATSPRATEPAASASAAALDRAIASRPSKLAELTPEQRRELPPLVVNGSVWSDNAASRFVILNGQVLREGDAVVPGLVLEKLQPKAALLRWRGLLMELPL